MYGAFLNLTPTEFANATGIYLGSFIAVQVVNDLFFSAHSGAGVLVGETFLLRVSNYLLLEACKWHGVGMAHAVVSAPAGRSIGKDPNRETNLGLIAKTVAGPVLSYYHRV
jgi:hypothetical protein